MDASLKTFKPSADGKYSLATTIDGPPAAELCGGKTLPAGCARLRSRKQPTPQRKTPKTRVIREIKAQQASTKLVIPKGPFAKLVREIAQKFTANPDLRFQQEALDNIQEATEDYMAGVFLKADSIRAINKVNTLGVMHIDYVLNGKCN